MSVISESPTHLEDSGLMNRRYPMPLEHYERIARNLANLWANGNDGARTCILVALLKAAQGNVAADLLERIPDPVGPVRDGLVAAVRAAKLALFVIRKQGVMPNSSWEAGFNKDLKIAEDALAAPQSAGVSENDSARNSTRIEGSESSDSANAKSNIERNLKCKD